MSVTDPYEVLGVERGATQDAIKSAFRKLARQYHPDVNPEDGAEDRFKEVGEAYTILGDADRRAKYDRYGVAEDNVGQNVGDMFTEAGFGDLFEAFFGGFGGQRRRSRDRHGEDIRADALIELTDVLHGIEYRVDYRRLEQCGECAGTGSEGGEPPTRCTVCGGAGLVQHIQDTFLGQVRTSTTCPNCSGMGTVIVNPCRTCGGRALQPADASTAVNIPPGIEHGATLRLTGGGSHGVGVGSPGDLYLVVAVKDRPGFRRDGRALHVDATLTYAQCALGDRIEIDGLEGAVELTVLAGTQPNAKLRVKGEGLPALHGGRRGDLIARAVLQVPNKLSEEATELLTKFAEVSDEPIPKGDGGGSFLGGLFKKK